VNEILRRMVAEGVLGSVKAYYGVQVGVKPPTFLVYVNREEVKPSVLRAMREYIRKSLNLVGTGVRVKVRKK
jgi:GTP-binding protein